MPKFIQNDEIQVNTKATKEFTDREEPRRAFWEKYNLVKSKMAEGNNAPIQVLTYYGFGGIGKTSLLHKLMEELNQKEPKAKVEFLDFEKLVEFNNNLLDILKVIKQDLKDKYKFTFPIFDLVVYVYETKMGKTATKPELSSIFDENKELGFLKDVISDIPLIGTFAKVIYYADAGKNLIQERLRNNKLRQRLLEIENTSVEDIKKHFAYYFSIDLKENLKREKEPFVFFIDTYEKLVNELTQIGEPLKNDLWLRDDEGLICRIPNVIWVIAGREKLKWQDLDESWEGTIEQHLLGTLSFQDTSSFLKTAGIDKEELIKQIFNLTHGTPMYLDMCVDTYVKLIEKGKEPQIEDFSGNTIKLVNRFLMYMKDMERDFSTMLAYVPEWTDETIEEVSMKMNGTFSYSLYEKVKNFSFIVNENGKYKIHESIRDIIIANTPEMLRRKYEKILQKNENSKLEKISNEDNSRIEKIYKVEENNNITYIEKYNSKKAYEQVIENLSIKLINEKDEINFNGTARFLLEKLEEYEERFNKTIKLKYLKQIHFKNDNLKNNKYYNLLQIYIYPDVSLEYYSKDYIKMYDTLINTCEATEEEALFPIKHCLRWNDYPIYNTRYIGDFFDFVSSKFGKQSLYYISLCGLCKHDMDGKQKEFIERIREYSNSNNIKDKFYIYLILNASDKYSVEYSIMEKYNNRECVYEEKYKKEVTKEVMFNLKLALKALKENSNLLDETILGKLYSIADVSLTNIIFDYLYSVKYIALNTSNQEIIDYFLNILKKFLGGEENEEENVVQDIDTRNKIIVFLRELKEHYIELYGKDHYNVIEIKNYIDKFEGLTVQKFDERIKDKINRFGIRDEKTIRTYHIYVKELMNRKENDEKYFECIYGYLKEILLSFSDEVIQNKEKTALYKERDVVRDTKTYLKYLSKEKYYENIWKIDKILIKFYDDDDSWNFADDMFEDAEDIFTNVFKGNIVNESQIQNAIQITEIVLNNNYLNPLIEELLIRYIIFKVYNFVKNEISILEKSEFIDKISNIEKDIEKVNIGCFRAAFTELYWVLIGETFIDLDYLWRAIKEYIYVIKSLKELRLNYSIEFVKRDNNVILLSAYIGLLEIPMYTKESYNYIEDAIKIDNMANGKLSYELNMLKKIADRYIEICRKERSKKSHELFDTSIEDIEKIFLDKKKDK